MTITCPHCDRTFDPDELVVSETDAEAIFKMYPAQRRVAKDKTLAAIRRALKEVKFPELKRRVAAFVIAWDNADLAFCPNSLTWFNQKRWADDPSTWAPKKKPERNGPPIGIQIQNLEQAIERHPANPEFISYREEKVTAAQQADLKAKYERLDVLRQQRAAQI